MITGNAEKIVQYLMRGDKTQIWDLSPHREKRSLTQNAYYWKLITLLARKLHISNARLHNLMLRECAPSFEIDGKVAMQPIPDTEKAENEVLESEVFHLRPTSGVITGNDGLTYRWYVVLRGSSTFNVMEMSALVDRLVEDCKEQDIEVLPPDELARMRAMELEHEKQHSNRPQ